MNINELKTIILQGESEFVEFKKSIAEIDTAFKTVCAFLNNKGGVVLIGVNNDGKAVGQPATDMNMQKIAANIRKIQSIQQNEVDVSYSDIAGKPVIVIKVDSGRNKPYTYETRAYERFQNTTSLMSHDRLCFLITNNHSNYSWETLLSDQYDLNDLDKELIKNVIRTSVEKGRLSQEVLFEDAIQSLKKLGLIKNNKATNAAIVLFGKEFLPDYPQCLLKMARFDGLTKSVFKDKLSLQGNIFHLLNEAMNFSGRHLPVGAKIEDGELERKEIPMIPFKALREAILNALGHRDYSSRHGDMALAIYDDRLEIENNGGLLHGLTVEKIKNGDVSSEQRRNPLITQVLDKCGYIERWGRGVQEIISSCKEAGYQEPIFLNNEHGFKVIFKFSQDLNSNFLNKKLGGHDFNALIISARQKIILKLFIEKKENPLKIKEILENLTNLSISESTLKRELVYLKNNEFISTHGKAQKTEWFVLKENLTNIKKIL